MSTEELDPGAVEFARRTGALLERSAQELPAHIRSRLTRARYAALERRAAPSAYGSYAWRRWLPAGAAAAAVLTVLMLQAPHTGTEVAQSNAAGEDFELLADSSALALAQDQLTQGEEVDYEFYDWAVNGAQDERGAETGS